jgi:hypothetical protein
VDPGRVVCEHEILHLRIGLLLPRLTEEDHHHDPFRLLDVDFLVVEREQPIYYELALRRLQDPNLLEMQQIAARARVELLGLRGVEDPHRGGPRRRALEFRGVQRVEPVERAFDLAIAEAGALQLFFQLVAIRLGVVVTIDEGFEQVHEDVENGFFHHSLFARRE